MLPARQSYFSCLSPVQHGSLNLPLDAGEVLPARQSYFSCLCLPAEHQPRCSSIGGQGSPVPMRWAIAGPRLSPPRPVAPKPRNSLRRSVGPTHACQTVPSEHVDLPGLPHKLLLGTSSRQISNTYLGGNLSLEAVLHYIAFWGFTGFGPFPARSPPPGQHA